MIVNVINSLKPKNTCHFPWKMGLLTRENSTVNIIHKKLCIPECPRRSFLDTLVSFIRWDQAKFLHESVDENHKKMGPIYKDHVGPVTAIFISSSEDYRRVFGMEGATPQHFLPESWLVYNKIRQCRRGLLFMDGDEWLHFRRIMNRLLLVPNFASNIISHSCHEAAVALTEEWAETCSTNGTINNLEKRLYRWSIEVIIATLLGSSWKEYKETARHESEKLAGFLHKVFVLSAKLSLLPTEYVVKLQLPLWREFLRVADDSLETVQKIVPEMVRLQGNGLLHLMQREGVGEQDLSRIITDLVIAAGDTTAYSAQWALFLLATHPQVQEKIVERVGDLSLNEMINDPYLKGVIKESLRLYPTAPFITRILPEDGFLGGYPVSQGELIVMSLYTSGRDPKNFPEPNRFLPERWMRNDKNQYNSVVNPYASIPFALGARSCIGRKLAEAQMILTLAELVKKFRIECLNAESIKMILHMISVPSEAVQLKLTRRET